MCGIAAIFSYGGRTPVNREELHTIRDAMRARGPDGEGVWISDDRTIGLAHRRLAIIDLSETASQPMMSADGSSVVIFNGEIYNYKELRSELEGQGHRFRTMSDTEVLLGMYERYGPDMVLRLRGMFAFAIWDTRRRSLFLARDPFGIKPLYISDDGSTIRVSSQVKALIGGAGVNCALDPAGQVGFLLWGYIPEPYTLYRGVRCLPSGSTLSIDADGRREARKYVDLSEELSRETALGRTTSPEEVRERLRAALLETLRYHLVADVPVGVFLSAGLDSTTLTLLTRELGKGDLHTITLGFDEFEGSDLDEVPLAELVARQCGALHRTQRVTRQDFEGELRNFLSSMDQPSIDGLNTYFVSRAATRAGLKVAMSGLGGDELFAGYPSFRQIPKVVKALGKVTLMPRLGKVFRYVTAPLLQHFTSPKYAGLLEYGGTYGGAYLLRRGMYMPWELPTLLDGEVVKAGWEELQTLARLSQTTRVVRSPQLKISALEGQWYMRNQLLRDTDWASMAHSLEVRTPLVDIELLRTVVGLSPHGRAPSKRDLARTPQQSLPNEVLQRQKTGFATPLRRWLIARNETSGMGRGMRGWALQVMREAIGAFPATL